MSQIVLMQPDELASMLRSAVREGVAEAMRLVGQKSEEGLTDVEAAEFLGVQAATLRSWRSQKKGPRYQKIGNRLVRYRKNDLVDWQQGQSVMTIN